MPSPGFSNTVKFQLWCTLWCFGTLQLWVGPKVYGRWIPRVILERATFIYTHADKHLQTSPAELFLSASTNLSAAERYFGELRGGCFSGREKHRHGPEGFPFQGNLGTSDCPASVGLGLLSKCQQCSPETSTAIQRLVFYFFLQFSLRDAAIKE